MPPVCFKPKYEASYRVGIAVVSLLVACILVLTAATGELAHPDVKESQVLFIAAIFAAAIFRLPFVYLREICFGDHLVIRRYLLPDAAYQYGEIRDVGLRGFRVGRLSVRWDRMENADELGNALADLFEQNKIFESQMDGSMVRHDLATLFALRYGSLLGLGAATLMWAWGQHVRLYPTKLAYALVVQAFIVAAYLLRRLSLPKVVNEPVRSFTE